VSIGYFTKEKKKRCFLVWLSPHQKYMTLAYKFVKWDIPALETLKESRAYVLARKLEDGTLTRAEKNEITAMAREYGHIRLMGWLFPLHALKTYYVKQYGHIQGYRAVDKTALRACLSGRIQNITERT
jgi:hypothetical protein